MATTSGTLDNLAPKDEAMFGGWGSYLAVFIISAILAFILLWALNPKIVQKGHGYGDNDDGRDGVEGNGGHGQNWHRQPDPAKVLVGALLIALVVVLIYWVCYKCK